MTKTNTPETITITPLEMESVSFWLVGKTPLMLNALANKSTVSRGVQELLFPSPKKTQAQKAQTLKHDPRFEFRTSSHTFSDPSTPTLIALPATAVKGAMRSAGLLMKASNKSASKAMLGKLLFVEGDDLPVYGVPELHMIPVRQSDMARTPDIRTRAVVRDWAAPVTVRFLSTLINVKAVINLAQAAGLGIGVGDYRPEKGAGNFGQFDVLDDTAMTEQCSGLLELGRAAQETAFEQAVPYDDFAANTLAWFDKTLIERGMKASA